MSSGSFEVARRGLAVLRSMRGLSGKLAQAAELIDPAWGPEPAALADELRSGAPEPVPFRVVERELREAWGVKPSAIVSEIDPEPAAMASAGQVHRAVLADGGRDVAVKVLHPGAEEALRADLANLGLVAQLATAVVPGLDARALSAELRERLLEEFDLEFEAQAQRTFARAYRGHPFVFVPAPLTELSHAGVLVSEWLEDGVGVDDPDAYGEALARFHLGSLLHLGTFSADPHPGNHRRLADGRLGVVDFGAVGRAEAAWVAAQLDLAAAVADGDPDLVLHDLAALGYVAEPERLSKDRWIAAAEGWAGWLGAGAGGPPPAADATLLEEGLRFARFPARDLQVGRMVSGLAAVLRSLGATGVPWARIAQETYAGAEPATELGRADAEFWAARGSRAATVQALRR